MAYATIRAPFDGVITDRLVDPGAFVRSAAEGVTRPLLTISKIDRLRLALEIPETDTPFVRIGTPVSIDVKALHTEPIKATITRTAVAIKPETRTMRAEVDLPNADGKLAPGMYAQVTINLESKEQAMVIPSKAIRVKGRNLFVLVDDAGIVQSRDISIGYDDGIWVEVLTGLTDDERIITSAGSDIAPGSPIKASLVASQAATPGSPS